MLKISYKQNLHSSMYIFNKVKLSAIIQQVLHTFSVFTIFKTGYPMYLYQIKKCDSLYNANCTNKFLLIIYYKYHTLMFQ